MDGAYICCRKLVVVALQRVFFYPGSFQDSYEAYVIYCFCYLLIALLGTEDNVQEIIQNKSDHDLEHMMPFKWVMSTFDRSQFLIKVKRGVLQYVVVKIVCTIVTLITSSIIISPPDENLFGENSYNPLRFHVYVLILVNCSQIWAMYCLVLFLSRVHERTCPIPAFRQICLRQSRCFF